jgi:hypothetical protein
VQVRGTASGNKPAVSIATSVLNVAAVAPQSQGGCLVVATALNAQTEVPRGAVPGASGQSTAAPAAKASGGGLSTGAKAAIIIGVAAGGGAGAAIALSGKKSSTSP